MCRTGFFDGWISTKTIAPMAYIDTVPEHEPRLSDRALLHYVLFLPVCLLVFQSYFKQQILAVESLGITSCNWWIYWGIRAGLIGSFVWLLRILPNKISSSSQIATRDVYEQLRRHYDPLLGLRAVACLLVFLGHWFLVVFPPTAPAEIPVEYYARAILSASPWSGVWMFFCLSGYLIGKGFVTNRHTIDRDGLINFYRNRLLRIVPVYWATMLIVSALEKPEYLNISSRSVLASLFDAILFDLKGGGVIGALWSISTEFQFYLLSPLLFLILQPLASRERLLIATAIFLSLAWAAIKFLILSHYPEHWHDKVYFPLLSNLDCFLLGMIVSFHVQKARDRNLYLQNGMLVASVGLVIFYVAISLWSYPEMVTFPGMPGSSTRIYFLSIGPTVVAICTGVMIYVFECAARYPIRLRFLWLAQTALGTWTYCLYVWHEPVINSLRRKFPTYLSLGESIAIFPFGFILSAAIAWIFYFHLEKYYDAKRG